MFVFRYLFKKPFTVFASKAGRQLFSLFLRYGHVGRYQQRKISFLGYHFIVPDVPSFLFQYEEIFFLDSYRFQCTNQSPFIIDCGANIGSSIVYFKRNWPQSNILAFEADTNVAAICAQNLAQNHINGVKLIPKAVWTHNQGIEMALEGSDAGSVFGSGKKTTIPSLRLRDVLAENSQIDMLKMDIEGAEIEVISDCADVLGKVSNIFIEYHAIIGQPQKLDLLLSILSAQNFRYYVSEAQHRLSPLVNKRYKSNNWCDLQLNIHAYRQ
jgi:FkbM family methyltransferase